MCVNGTEALSSGDAPPVVLAEDLQRDPEGTLRALCAALDMPFDSEMLTWTPGPRPEIDGVWRGPSIPSHHVLRACSPRLCVSIRSTTGEKKVSRDFTSVEVF